MKTSFEILVLTFVFGFSCGQNSLRFGNDYNNYEYEFGSPHLIDGEDGTKKIGELEFDVEVAEETPKPGDSIPEIVVDKNDYFEDSNDISQSMDGLPVELTNKSERVGDIMFNIEVADKQINSSEESDESDDTRQAFPSDLVKNLKNVTKTSTSTTISTTINLDNIQRAAELPDVSLPPSSMTSEDQTTNAEIVTDAITSPSTNKEPEKETKMWPIYLIAVIFIILAITGVVWALIRLHMVSKAEDDLEKQAIEKSAGAKEPEAAAAGPAEVPPPDQSKPSADSDSVHSLRSDFNEDNRSVRSAI